MVDGFGRFLLPKCISGNVSWKGIGMTDDRVYPTGLTEKEALEINDGLKWGTRIYGGIAVFAHVLAYILTPWMH